MSAIFDKLKKRRFCTYVTAIMLAFPIFLYYFVYTEETDTVLSDAEPRILVIDAGHGGIDSGAVAADGSKESDINLAIALKLRALAEFYGQNNLMIRQDDITMSDLPSYSERRDLERRAELVNSAGKCVYISIHQNCYPTGQPSGSLVIFSSDEQSEALGKLTHENMVKSLDPENRRVAEPADKSYYILSNVNCPAILIECGFMSNFSEMERLKTSEYQSALAAVMMASFLQYSQSANYI